MYTDNKIYECFHNVNQHLCFVSCFLHCSHVLIFAPTFFLNTHGINHSHNAIKIVMVIALFCLIEKKGL